MKAKKRMFKPEVVLPLQKPVLIRTKPNTPVCNYLAMYLCVCVIVVIFHTITSYLCSYVCMILLCLGFLISSHLTDIKLLSCNHDKIQRYAKQIYTLGVKKCMVNQNQIGVTMTLTLQHKQKHMNS